MRTKISYCFGVIMLAIVQVLPCADFPACFPRHTVSSRHVRLHMLPLGTFMDQLCLNNLESL